MLRSCHNTAKHPDTVRDTWDRIATSLSMRTPRSQTVVRAARSSLRHEQQQMADGSVNEWSNTRKFLISLCSAVNDLTATSQTLRPGKLTGWTGAGWQTQGDKSPVSAYHQHIDEG